MGYCSIEEAWGSNLLTAPPKNKLHPIQQKRHKGEQKKKQETGMYQCTYGDTSCGNVVNRNNNFNDMKKQVAMGVQPFPNGAPGPQNYTYSPQYPWNQWARAGYMQYPYQIYNNPYVNFPDISHQLSTNPQQHPGNYNPPIEYPYNAYRPEFPREMTRRVENFGNSNCPNCSNCSLDQKNIRTCITYFIFFLIALAVILCVFMICLSK
jgi:hypothetical protein